MRDRTRVIIGIIAALFVLIVAVLWSFSPKAAPFAPASQVAIGSTTTSGTVLPLTQTGQTYRQVLAFNGTTRTYLLHLPPANSVKGLLPLVLAFHGAGENGLLMSSRGISLIADQVGFIVVYPDGSNQTGNAAEGFT